MASDSQRQKVRWYHMRTTKLTGEYCGGLLAGFGLGCLLTAYLCHKEIVHAEPSIPFSFLILGSALIAGGSTIAYRWQSHNVSDRD